MSEHIYGVYAPDSDVASKIKDGFFVVVVCDERYTSDKPFPDISVLEINDCLCAADFVKRSTALKNKIDWYITAKRFKHGLNDPGYEHRFNTAEQANAFLEDLKTMGYWVPDGMFFRAS